MMLSDFLIHSISIFSTNEGRDASGGLTTTQGPPLAQNVPGKVQDAGSDQVLLYGFRELDTTHVIFTEQAGIQNGYTIQFGNFLYRVTSIAYRRGAGGISDFYVIGAVEVNRQL